MKFLNALEQSKSHIRSLWYAIALAIFINAVTLLGWMHSQSTIRIQIPPQIPVNGLIVAQGEVPKTTVYSFAYYVWQSLNYWQKDGMQDYQTQIDRFSPFLTPDFKVSLIQNYNNLLNDGELQERIRLMEGNEGSEYAPEDVIEEGHGTWIVHLKMRLTEMLSSNAKVVKDVEMEYTLKIVQYDVNATQNPWGLAIAGFAENPVRTVTIV
ncbi:MAG: TIGR03746 family integrating conjugative element protein [Gammaproteobacteria bacterium]|nr:TIGR03746 family integrating conjugative element protein [Gammaproteobacteria bacterium]MBY0544836.1 TIGR03746 family integrating conjugative element protein [Gammaproteobacteria bacterium]